MIKNQGEKIKTLLKEIDDLRSAEESGDKDKLIK